MIDPELAKANAIAYAQFTGIQVLLQEQLGHGSDGVVWLSSRESVIKAFFRQESYERERNCYQRLRLHNVRKIRRFSVPALIGYSDGFLVVEMGLVEPPFLLDFGKAYLDEKAPYHHDEQLMENCYVEWRELYEENWEEVRRVIRSLEGYGIYYYDPRPSNICFENEEDSGDNR